MILLRDVTELRSRERELLTKDATIKEIHHRVKNNLQTVAALLRLQFATDGGAARARRALDDAVRRVGTIAVVHETLKQLLAPDEAAGAVSVEEKGNRTPDHPARRRPFPVRKRGREPGILSDPSASGGGDQQSSWPCPGVGHTDDQPIRSLRYQDNFELSRERAVSVAKILQRTIDNPARLSFDGVGSSEPRYRPESDPENRSRNRRVEIIHVRGT